MNATFLKQYGPWALITGASSGIGASFAQQLAKLGFNLVLIARREPLLSTLANELTQNYGVEIRTISADLSHDNFMQEVTKHTANIDIGLLINNAGFATTGALLDNPIQRELELLHVNCRAPLLLTHHYGKMMQQRRQGGIIFLASIVAFSASPLWSQYAASKSYNLMMAEALHEELKESGIDVLALCPGATSTEFQQVANIRDFMSMDADSVATTGLKALGKQSSVIAGWLNNYNIFCLRFFPRWLNTKIFGKVIGKVQLKH